MIATDKRKAIFLLHQEGMPVRAMVRQLGLSRNAVREIIRQKGEPPQSIRSDKKPVAEALLRRLYQECQGHVVRVHEKLVEEEGLTLSYSTLLRRLQEYGISHPPQTRCERVPDEPGLEMQHDTSLYRVSVAGQSIPLVASLIYLRYSKRRYLKFYRTFDRFKMKCFFHEALLFWGYSARQCIIDNTNLARLRGTGAQAVIHPEMEAFAKQYGFSFRCHAIKHCNRKAGEERSFWTVETNFLPGRTFASLEDLNQQALAWATVRLEQKPQGPAGLIPAKAFEHERGFLTLLPPQLPAPYRDHDRGIDQYGFVHFGANYYYVPGTDRTDVKVLEYSDRMQIYRQRQCVVEYPLPADGIKNQEFSSADLPKPRHHAHHRRCSSQAEESYLRHLAPAVSEYLDFALASGLFQRHEFIRKLLSLSRQMSAELFVKTLQRARKYQITTLATLERIALLYLQQGTGELPRVEVDEAFHQREAYQEGSFTEPPDLSLYQDPPPADHE
jgi:transposase